MKGDRLALVNQQIIRFALEREAASVRAPGTRPCVRPVITVSRQIGSGGREIAQGVALRLGYPVFDREIIEDVSRQAGVQQSILDALDERTRSGIEQWMDGVLHQSILSANEFIIALGKTLITLSRMGSAVILGRGANFLLEGEPALHVRIVASPESRIRNVMHRSACSRDEAETRVQSVDRERRLFVEKYLHRNIDDATAYDLVLNTDHIGQDQVILLIDETYRKVHALGPEVNMPAPGVV